MNKAEFDNSSTRLCWYCGEVRPADQVAPGEPLRRLLHNHTGIESSPHQQFSIEDACRVADGEAAGVCRVCVDRLSNGLTSATVDYRHRHEEAKEDLLVEMCDVEMGMISIAEMKYHVGCWFGLHPRFPETVGFESLPLQDLYARGWRLGAPLMLSRDVVEIWNPTAGIQTTHDTHMDCFRYFSEQVLVDGARPSEEFVAFLMHIRAFIADLAIDNLSDPDSTAWLGR